MDMEILNNYFSFHPLKKTYLSFSEEARQGALKLAERDVLCAMELDEMPENPSPRMQASICEQTLFLLINPKVLAGSQDAPSGSNLGLRALCLLPTKGPVFEQNELFASCHFRRG